MYDRIFNFSAGPSNLPEKVLEEARDDLLNHKGSGMSVMEMSHRSKEYDAIIQAAEQGLKELLNVPDDYSILFLQGGASTQFAMIPMNLYVENKPVDVIHTGSWTKKAIDELEKLCPYNTIYSGKDNKFTKIPSPGEYKMNPDASYLHIASNNTIRGTQWKTFPETGSVPLIADMSSDILSKPLDISKFGLIFAGAQKNIGPAGVTVVIIKNELAQRCGEKVPTMLQYSTHIKSKSLYNTPPTFGIYVIKLVCDWLKNMGGLSAMEKINEEKAKIIYDELENNDFFYCPVEKNSRSLMNIVFRITGDKEELEAKFVAEAKAAGLSGLKGHKSVGGLRASVYNAHPLEGAKALADFMKEFAAKNG